MKPFCEAVVLHVLPTVRAILARKLSERGLKNTEIAERLGLTRAAVTQYLSKARGQQARLLCGNKKVDALLDAIAARLAKGMSQEESMAAFCGVCREIRKQRLLCKLHAGPKECVVCVPRA